MRFIDIDSIILTRYKITEELGGGGQSFVYKAIDLTVKNSKSWQRTVFIKQYSDLINIKEVYPVVKNHFSEISKRLKDIKNFICLPNDIYISNEFGSIIAVFPFVQGKKLSEKLKEGLDYESRVRIAFAIVNTFRKVHEKSIAHLDLKPDNIVVYHDPEDKNIYIQIIDLDGSKLDGKSIRESIVKTPGYSSPEHYQDNANKLTSISSDVFSLGITLLEVLINKYPFDSTKTYLQDAYKKEFSFDSSSIHGDIIRLLLSCLDFTPFNRPSAGKILSVFNKHFDNTFLAISDGDRWSPKKKKINVQLLYKDEKGIFSRVYYENKIVTSNDLRGSGIENLNGELFALMFDNENCYLYTSNNYHKILLDDYKIYSRKLYPLLSKQQLSVAGKCFTLNVSYFE